MLLTLVGLPVVAGAASFFIRRHQTRRLVLVGTALLHLMGTLLVWRTGAGELLDGWLRLDAPGQLFLTVTSVLFAAASLQAVGYLDAQQKQSGATATATGFAFAKVPEAVFTGCLLLFLATMSLVTMCQHFGLLWVAVEATTLASAPLVYFHRDGRSLEATWKYLVVCSVGIALALLGSFFLAVASSAQAVPMVISNLMAVGPELHASWLKAAMVFFLVGYGTKMGLAPLHTWLPDAHSEAPAVVSALLSGAVLNCAFLAILRALQVCTAAGLGEFAREMLLVLGLVSMATAAVFVIRQPDYKRLLAYSSVEHMGILAVGIGLGGAGAFGAMLHAVNHSLAKGMLFLVAGQVLAVFATKQAAQVRGMLAGYPVMGVMWMAGFLAVSGVPPFGTFLSELTIAKAALEQNRPGVLIAFLLLLAIVFTGMASAFLPMAQGKWQGQVPTQARAWGRFVPAAVLGCLCALCGVHVPQVVGQVLQSAAVTFGGN